MTNRAKEKGSRWEREVVAYLRANGFDAERTYGAGRKDDVGDVRGVPGVVIECKDVAQPAWSAWEAETERERLNAGASVGFIAHKKPRRPVGDARCVIPLSQLVALMKAARG